MRRDREERGYDGEWEYIKPDGYKINNEISNELLIEYKNKFNRYLNKLCDINNKDCNNLLENMLNITIRHSLSSLEVTAMAQRIEYLSNIIPQRRPYLFIQLIFYWYFILSNQYILK